MAKCTMSIEHRSPSIKEFWFYRWSLHIKQPSFTCHSSFSFQISLRFDSVKEDPPSYPLLLPYSYLHRFNLTFNPLFFTPSLIKSLPPSFPNLTPPPFPFPDSPNKEYFMWYFIPSCPLPSLKKVQLKFFPSPTSSAFSPHFFP